MSFNTRVQPRMGVETAGHRRHRYATPLAGRPEQMGREGVGRAVLHIIAGLDPAAGGPPHSAVATALALRQHGIANEVAFPIERGRERSVAEFVATLNASGIGVKSFEEPRVFGSFGGRWGVSPRLALWLIRYGSRFEVIHVHSGWTFTTVLGLLFAKISGRVSVLSTHESLTDFDSKKSGPFRRRTKRLLRWVYMRSFDVVVVASALEQRDMGDEGLRSVVVPHAVLGISGVRQNLSDESELRVGFLGRLHPKKNIELLVDALGLLPEQVSLHVAGDGPLAYRESLVARAKAHGVDKRIRWLGFADGVGKRKFLASIDVLAMPSAFECFGVSAVEALSAGLPVIVSPQVGIADVVQEYNCGQVVPAVVHDIARALDDLRKNASVRQQFSRNASIAVSREFSLETHGERIMAEYEGAVRARSRRQGRGQ